MIDLEAVKQSLIPNPHLTDDHFIGVLTATCKMLVAEVERLRASEKNWVQRYDDSQAAYNVNTSVLKSRETQLAEANKEIENLKLKLVDATAYAKAFSSKLDRMYEENEVLREENMEYEVAYECALKYNCESVNKLTTLTEQHAKAVEALQQYQSRHEAGLLPCRFTYERGRKALDIGETHECCPNPEE